MDQTSLWTPLGGCGGRTVTLVVLGRLLVTFVLVAGTTTAVVGGAMSVGPAAVADRPDGSGTLTDPYVVRTVAELQWMATDPAAHYALGTDIDASETASWNGGAGFVPVGDHSTPFTGTFDGRGYVVDGLVVDRPGEDGVGLFGVTGDGATVHRVTLTAIEVSGAHDTGGLVGHNGGTVSDSSVSGTVVGPVRVGGVVGYNDGQLEQSSTAGAVSGTLAVGGLVGHNGGVVRESFTAASVAGSMDVGGLVGTSAGTVDDSYATGDISGVFDVGGLLAENTGTVTSSYWDVETSDQLSSAGGTGLTTDRMTGSAAENAMAGFDFSETWETTDSYPQLATDEPVGLLVALAGADGRFQFPEVLAAIDHFNDGTPVPGTGGQPVRFVDVLRVIELFNSGASA